MCLAALLLILLGAGCRGPQTPAPAVQAPAPAPGAPRAALPEGLGELIGGYIVAPGLEDCLCTDPKGCVEIGPGDPIRLGWMLAFSGADAALGADTRRGIEIAIDDRKGQLLGHGIELVGEDELCSAEGGWTAGARLSADSRLVAVVGTSCSSAARAAIPQMCSAGIPMVSASNTAPDLTAADRPADYWCYLRTSYNDQVQGAAMAEFAWQRGIKRAATIQDGSLYAGQLQQAFADRFKELGGAITAQEAVAPNDTDMKPLLTRIAATSPELIYYPIFIAEGSRITRQAREVPGLEKVRLASADGVFSPDFLKAAGDAALGMYFSSPDFSAFGPAYQDFLVKHKAKYGEDVLAPFHAHGYDAFNLIAAAIEKVAVKNAGGSLCIPRQALVEAMLATKDLKGLTGNLTCTPAGDCADPVFAVYETMDGDPASWNPGAEPRANPRKIWPMQ
jgi:branched-chain amino acid transport system substrate-binding protein